MCDTVQAKKGKPNVTFNEKLKPGKENAVFQGLKEAFRLSSPYKDDNSSIEYINDPFPCCVIPNFINDADFPSQLKDELESLNFIEKSNDLYKFKQSEDLCGSNLPCISIFRNIVFCDFRSLVSELSGIDLNDTVDLSCARYEHTDTLLCHDDELDNRRIAFIYYLVPPWKKEDGGTLDLFSVDKNGQPAEITRSLIPSFNSLFFFEVTPLSFHQVAEVLSKGKCRLSVSGWFHGPTLKRPPPFVEQSLIYQPPLDIEDEALIEWVNPIYLNPEIVCSIQEQFEEENEILLKDFLLEEKYKAIESELNSFDLDWCRQGPPNKRCFDRVDDFSTSPTLRAAVTFLGSRPMFKLLTKLTGLDLAEIPEQENDDDEEEGEEKTDNSVNGKEKTARSHTAVRRWSHGCYTLMYDGDVEEAEYSLDSILYFDVKNWSLECGGFTSYVTKEDDEELLTIEPSSNCLTLTYAEPDTMHFVKHINSRSILSSEGSTKDSGNCFYDITTKYLE